MIRRGQISGKPDITVPTPCCAQSSSYDNRLRVASDVVLEASSQWLHYNGHKKITLYKKQSMYWLRTVIGAKWRWNYTWRPGRLSSWLEPQSSCPTASEVTPSGLSFYSRSRWKTELVFPAVGQGVKEPHMQRGILCDIFPQLPWAFFFENEMQLKPYPFVECK